MMMMMVIMMMKMITRLEKHKVLQTKELRLSYPRYVFVKFRFIFL